MPAGSGGARRPESPTPSRCWRASPGRSAGGAPFRARHLPAPLAAVRERLETGRDGGEQMVCILPGARDHGLEAISAACAEALETGIRNADLILDIAARRCRPGPVPQVPIPAGPELREPPAADPARYDRLLAGRRTDETK